VRLVSRPGNSADFVANALDESSRCPRWMWS
jgi:hypothetical protein